MGLTFSKGGPTFSRGGGEVQMLISIETYITCDFPWGVRTPYPPSGSAHVTLGFNSAPDLDPNCLHVWIQREGIGVRTPPPPWKMTSSMGFYTKISIWTPPPPPPLENVGTPPPPPMENIGPQALKPPTPPCKNSWICAWFDTLK